MRVSKPLTTGSTSWKRLSRRVVLLRSRRIFHTRLLVLLTNTSVYIPREYCPLLLRAKRNYFGATIQYDVTRLLADLVPCPSNVLHYSTAAVEPYPSFRLCWWHSSLMLWMCLSAIRYVDISDILDIGLRCCCRFHVRNRILGKLEIVHRLSASIYF